MRKVKEQYNTFKTAEDLVKKQPSSGIVETTTKAKVGRPIGKRTINKRTGFPFSLYISAEQKEILSDASHFSKMDQSDIVRTAMNLFFSKYIVNNRLNEKGFELVNEYVESTTDVEA